MKLSSLWRLQISSTRFLVAAYFSRSTNDILRSASKYPLIHAANHSLSEITANAGDGVWEMTDDQILERTIRELESVGFVDPEEGVERLSVRYLSRRQRHRAKQAEAPPRALRRRARTDVVGGHLPNRFRRKSKAL